MTMRVVKSFSMTPPAAAVIADMQPVINALGLTMQATAGQAIIDALALLPKAATKAREVTINMAAGLVDSAVALGTLTTVQSVFVKDLTGAIVPTLKLGGAGESPLTLAKGDTRDGFSVTGLLLNCGAGGGSITLELYGR
ncbi:hypothetical protein [Geothrix campi]|uniref:hypothetical protein n=1 Tax=Geothrix campi TaxID=2966450 RepID=UPI002148133B|nr:hypothetical protein [Geothrix sp. SG10]